MSDLQSDELRGAPPVENYQDRDFCWADEQEPAFEEQQVLSQLDSRVNKRQYVHALKFEFPFKLHELLEDATRDGNEHIVSWHPDGKAFTIHLKQEFETQIIPQYFPKAPKYRSFCRQLSIYGYKMDQDASSKYFRAYCNPLMVRGNPGLCAWMVREKVKGSSSSKKKISEQAACSRNHQQQKYKMEDESFVQEEEEEETTADHTVSLLHGGGVSLPNVLGPPSSPPTISGNKAAAQEQMSSSVITAVQQEGGDTISSSDHSIEDGLLEFAIAANEYLEQDSSSSEKSSPVAAAAAKHHYQANDDCFSTRSTAMSNNDEPLELTTSLMYNHGLEQYSESMIVDAIRHLLSPRHRQSISSCSS